MLRFLRKAKRPQFVSIGRAEVVMSKVDSCILNDYVIRAQHDFENTPIGGYEIDIFGITSGLYSHAGKTVIRKGYRVHVCIRSVDTFGLVESGAVGWGKLHEDYLEAIILLDPDRIRDILTEIRVSKLSGLRVAGGCDESGVMKLDLVSFSPEIPELAT